MDLGAVHWKVLSVPRGASSLFWPRFSLPVLDVESAYTELAVEATGSSFFLPVTSSEPSGFGVWDGSGGL